MDVHKTSKQTAERVAAAIARSGETLSSAARKAYIPRTTLHRKLNDTGEFTVTELLALSRATHTPFSQLLPDEALADAA